MNPCYFEKKQRNKQITKIGNDQIYVSVFSFTGTNGQNFVELTAPKGNLVTLDKEYQSRMLALFDTISMQKNQIYQMVLFLFVVVQQILQFDWMRHTTVHTQVKEVVLHDTFP